MYAVIFETEYVTRILFDGTFDECEDFFIANPEFCDECAFIQEIEVV